MPREVRDVAVVARHEHEERRVPEHLGYPTGILAAREGMRRERVPRVVEVSALQARFLEGSIPHAPPEVRDIDAAAPAFVQTRLRPNRCR